ncbi:hypothetical protein AU252_22910 (plasmid) [Pseudarthrobacter sulfonivorans]|uniref:Transposase IS204/IS1001/IS1096/IS1165 DDE domain-containing protein n=1 Tax=Pseudarthrobacter sulfonivorans TaxID=121292 RepID=A0A0U3QRI8_9MICC|nr:hypothetical protein AU252_11355 [Pseudarthrobacter sulfonivorans]ALV44139.1 hypothetical protein AU252_22910 [Pseudarthrobacter sulfonivorans]
MVDGRSKQAFKDWLAERPTAWRETVEAVAVLDPFHVARLAGKALDECRRRGQQAIHGHRGRTGL